MAKVRFESIDVRFPATELTEQELKKLDQQLDNLFGPKDGVVYELLQTYKNSIRAFVKVVKQKLNNSIFGGMVAGDTEIGIAPIRPAHFKDNGGNSLLGTNVVAKGDVFEVTFNSNWETLAEGSLHDDVGILLLGVIGVSASPIVDGIRIQVGQRSLLPIDIGNVKIRDNRNDVAIWNINSIPITPKEYFKIEVHSPTTGVTDQIKLLGLTVGLGRFLKQNF